MQNKPPCIMVLGTPRSGTSCVAGIVHHLGISMGENLMEADSWNPAGYYQDIDFEEINDDCYPLWHFPAWSDPKPENYGDCAGRITELAASRAAAGKPWGVKSNRLAFFFDAFLAGAGDDVRIIRTYRTKSASSASWRARSGHSLAASSALITRMDYAIGQVVLAYPAALTIHYAELLANPRTGVEAIAAICGVEATVAAVNWVNAELKRFD